MASWTERQKQLLSVADTNLFQDPRAASGSCLTFGLMGGWLLRLVCLWQQKYILSERCSCLNFHWIPTSYGSCSKLSDVSRCFYYEFWRERVYCFRLAIPLKGTTHSSRQHSFCKFLSKRSKLSHPSSLPSGLTHPSLLPLFFFSRIFILYIMVISYATWYALCRHYILAVASR